MALSGSERQRRWRERHPEKANAHLEALTGKRAEEKAGKTVAAECDHDDRGVRVELPLIYCGMCQRFLIVSDRAYEEAHKEWLSRPPERDGGG